ncbi:unknown [Clostridium sp. CAG:273]|nr:unknown [Clostridium sp. CAG:273]
MPNSSEGRLYDYSDEYLVNNSLEYTGAAKSNPKTLEIGSQGGTAYIRFSNTKIGNYTSNKDKEIVHNGTLLNKIGATNEVIKFNVSFDLTIQTDKNKYKTSISNIEMPSGNLIEEGTTQFEKTDMSDLIFKRVN